MNDEHVYSHGRTYTCNPTFTKLPLPIQLFFCTIVWNFCKGSGYDYSVKLFTRHFFVKAVQLMKPQLRSLQWKQTQCIYRCLFSSIIKVFHCSFLTSSHSPVQVGGSAAAAGRGCPRSHFTAAAGITHAHWGWT